MDMLSTGGCDCKDGKMPVPMFSKNSKYIGDRLVECLDCLGTELKLTPLGKELVEFLRTAQRLP